MSNPKKADAHLFEKKIEELHNDVTLGSRAKWTPYSYHFSDIRNIVSILRSGELLCRDYAINSPSFRDIASASVIQQTDAKWHSYVRFYFRPRTPTLYHNEGFRPATRQQLNAHCPVPVYLLFDLYSIIIRQDTLFSDGTLASNNVNVYSTGLEFQQLPFSQIYHDKWFTPEEKNTIIYHRHAEIVVPERVGLDSLKFIWCRSQAEYEMLKHLLPSEIWKKWRKRVVARRDISVFNHKWGYVEQATLTTQEIILKFNQPDNSLDKGLFNARLEIIETETNSLYSWEDANYHINESHSFDLSNMPFSEDYTVRFTLDGQLAYQNRYQKLDIPF